MLQFEVKIELGNDAMQTASDVARALRVIASWVHIMDNGAPLKVLHSQTILDANGNDVGRWRVVRVKGE